MLSHNIVLLRNKGLYPAFQGLLIFIAKFPASDVRCSQLNELLGFDIALKQITALFQVLGQSSFRSGYAWSDDSSSQVLTSGRGNVAFPWTSKAQKAQGQRRAAALLHGRKTFRSCFGRSLIASLEPMMCAAEVAPSGRGDY